MAGPSARLRAASSAVRRAALRLSDADRCERGRRADARRPLCYTPDSAWATSSVGRARARQARGRWFNSNVAHHVVTNATFPLLRARSCCSIALAIFAIQALATRRLFHGVSAAHLQSYLDAFSYGALIEPPARGAAPLPSHVSTLFRQGHYPQWLTLQWLAEHRRSRSLQSRACNLGPRPVKWCTSLTAGASSYRDASGRDHRHL